MMASDIGYQVVKNLYHEVEVPEEFMVDLQLKLPNDAIKNDNRDYPSYFLPGITNKVMASVLSYCTSRDFRFVFEVDPVTLFDLIQAAHHFQNKSLMDLTCKRLVSMVKSKSPTEIKTKFIINQDYDWIKNGKSSKRAQSSPCRITRRREKETFIKPSNFVYVQRSRLVTEVLNHIKRRKLCFNICVVKLLKYQSDEDLLATTRALSSYVEDQVLAECLKHDHVVRLFNILEQFTSRQDIQSVVVGILSCVNFTARENAVTTARIQLLVKVISEKGFNDYNYATTHLAVLTLANIAKALPKYIADILKSCALERVNRVLLVRDTGVMIDCIAMFLAAVCRTGDLSHLDKVDEALTTLKMLFEARAFSEHHIEQACYAFQYLTYGKELQIEELALKKLIGMLIGIIHEPPRDDCPFPGYALGVIGNIAIWGSSDQIKIFTSNSTVLDSLGVMMAGSKKIKKEACQIISNIAARTDGLIEKMHTARLIEPLCRLLEKDESDVKMEAAWAIYNGIYGSEFSPSLALPLWREIDNQP